MIDVPVVSRGAYVSPQSICSYLLIISLALYCVEQSGLCLVLKTRFDPIGLAPKSFRMIELLSSMITASHCFLSGLSIASSYERGLPSIVVEASALCISSETFTCALLLVNVSVLGLSLIL
jgi:hypothetical protein